MAKHKVSCPNCSVSLNVNEELLGKTAKCPGCKKPFTLPMIEREDESPFQIVEGDQSTSWTDEDAEDEQAVSVPPAVPRPQSNRVEEHLEIEERPALQVLAGVFRWTGIAALAIGIFGLFFAVYLLASSGGDPDEFASVPVTFGWAISSIFAGVVEIASGELVKLMVSLEQSQQMTVNELRSLRVDKG